MPFRKRPLTPQFLFHNSSLFCITGAWKLHLQIIFDRKKFRPMTLWQYQAGGLFIVGGGTTSKACSTLDFSLIMAARFWMAIKSYDKSCGHLYTFSLSPHMTWSSDCNLCEVKKMIFFFQSVKVWGCWINFILTNQILNLWNSIGHPICHSTEISF